MRAIVQELYAQLAKPQCRAAFQQYYTQSTFPQTSVASFATGLSARTAPRLSNLRKFPLQTVRSVSSAQKARDLNQQGIDDQVSSFDSALAQQKEKQRSAPWHREGADIPPVHRQRSAGAMTKGMYADQTSCITRLTCARQTTYYPCKASEACIAFDYDGSQLRYHSSSHDCF